MTSSGKQAHLKFGAHIYVWQDRYTDDDLLRILDSSARLGLEILEVGIGDDIKFDADALAQESRARNIELAMSPGGVWPMNCDISLKDENDRLAGIAWHKRAIDTCAECGATTYAGAIYGHPGRVSRGPADPDEPKRVADGLRELAEYGAQRNVRLAIEPMSHFRTHVANTPRQINTLLALADHPNLYSLMDTYHLTTEVPDLTQALVEMHPRLWGIHACENTRGAVGTGFLPWPDLAKKLVALQWNGYIGFEAYNSSWRGGAFARERGMFHNVCPDAEAFISASMKKLQTLFNAC
ncbi:MAG: sugar phosphate isomerase/epimerase [Lentisphaerae bacterium]|nr:sugar phosphate isomerase/epimerase [Lentisphaerota bacterium]